MTHHLSVKQESSVIHSNANLGVHGQGLLNLSGPGDSIEAQRLVLSLFYNIHVSCYMIYLLILPLMVMRFVCLCFAYVYFLNNNLSVRKIVYRVGNCTIFLAVQMTGDVIVNFLNYFTKIYRFRIKELYTSCNISFTGLCLVFFFYKIFPIICFLYHIKISELFL